MKAFIRLSLTLFVLFLTGCAATQTITRFDSNLPESFCIAEHDAVRDGVLQALEKGFHRHGARTTVIRGIYLQNNDLWISEIHPDEVLECDAIVFYVANWTWDISMYMHFANIWVTDRELTQNIAQATYQTGGGLDKWIDAEEKIIELVDEMYGTGYVAGTALE